jgi:hypothetical protein
LHAVLGFGALVGERDTARNHENKWVETHAIENRAFTGVIFFKKECLKKIFKKISELRKKI